MSFDKMKKPELLDVADKFAVDVPENATTAVIRAALAENGVTYDQYATIYLSSEEEEDVDFVETGVPEPEVVVQPVVVETPTRPVVDAPVLVRMTRANPTFEIRGYRFTKNNPFALVKPDDANYLVENDLGFRIASPREAEEFFG